ncbi:UNVERIFIED_CONTAM: hypothetical protein GTU68_046127 [Idotea baltica]|nr:hypothetical protein [Idotea baltica]
MKTAMRAKDTLTLGTVRMLKSAIKNQAIEKGGADAVLDDAEVTVVIRKEVKKRQDSLEQYNKAGRPELAEQEEKEIEVLNKYLPEPLSEDEIAKLIDEAVAEVGASSRKEMGQVMGILAKTTGGRVDGKTLSQAVMAKLS